MSRLPIRLSLLALIALPSLLFAAPRPNIVLIMTDDLGFADIGPYGGEIDTPNLNQLAAGGLRFRQFYNTAKCSQTRATMLSGRYYPEVSFTGQHRNSVTFAETLRTAGYKTLMSGKWHLLGEPTEQGFDRYFGHLAGAVNFFDGVSSDGLDTFRLDGKPFIVPDEGFYATDAMTDHALQFLQEEVPTDSEQPFLLYLAYNAPHYPLHAKKSDVEKYLGRYDMGWDELRKSRYQRQQDIGIIKPNTILSERPSEVPAWDTISPELRREHNLTMATYAAMIDCVDQNIGRVIDHLKARDQFENTLFIFLSDNGGCPFQRTRSPTREEMLMPWTAESYWTYDEGWAHASNTPFRWYKQNQHEGGISSPFIMHWPNGLGGKAGRIVDGPGHLIDIAPTLYELAGANYPQTYAGAPIGPLRGQSLVPILDGKSTGGPRELWQFFGGNRALRFGDWKISWEKNLKVWELYKLAEDRSETNNLAATMPEKLQEMISRYEALDTDIADQAPAVAAVNIGKE
jgi:arylsulfatase A-like enzyme